MGWAGEHLGPGRCEEIAQGLVPLLKPSGGRLLASCPFPGHPDKNPSFFYDPVKDSYHCYSHPDQSEASGDLVDLWARLNRVNDPKQALKDFIARYAPGHKKAGGRAGRSGDRRAQGNSGGRKFVPEAEWEKLAPLPEAWIERLEQVRGWSREVIARLDLRLWRNPVTGEERVAIPIRDLEGRLVNIRLYRPGAAKSKVISFWTGSKARGDKISYGEPPQLWPVGSLGIVA